MKELRYFIFILIVGINGNAYGQTSVSINYFRTPLVIEGNYTDQNLERKIYQYNLATNKYTIFVSKTFPPIIKYFHPRISLGGNYIQSRINAPKIKGDNLTIDDLTFLQFYFRNADDFIRKNYFLVSFAPSILMEINEKNFLEVGFSYSFLNNSNLPIEHTIYADPLTDLQLMLGYNFYLNENLSVNFQFLGILQNNNVIGNLGHNYQVRYRQFGVGLLYAFNR